jgi:hypothetical protein
MKAGDLTTLENVKGWLNTGSATFPSTDDVLLGRMITAASRFVLTWLSRDIVATDYTVMLNGDGGNQLFTKQYPIISVSAVSVNGTALKTATNPPTGAGFLFSDESVFYVGGNFSQGFQNIGLTYTAGFQATETITIPDDNKFLVPVATLNRPWVVDRGISLNGVAFLKVKAAPSLGQYAVVAENGVMNYLFAQADAVANPDVTVTYGYCPEDLEQALIEMIGERYSTRERIGQVSKSFGGEVVAFSQKDFNDNNRDTFNQYKNVVPV